MLRPNVGLLTRTLQNQPQFATNIVFSQLPRASVAMGIRAYSSNQGKQILLRDHGVFGELNQSNVLDTVTNSFL